MKHLSFKDYYENKELLRKAGIESPRVWSEYTVTKYCKIPVVESVDEEKQYLALKPKDVVKILWEYDDSTPILKKLIIITDSEGDYIPCWTSNKMFEWAGSNCQPSIL